MADYCSSVEYLYGLQKYGVKLGLKKTKAMLAILGNPHHDFAAIHVAGTNGKGSASAIAASILAVSGLRVGLFTSPHLVSFTERMRINNRQIEESEVISLTKEIKSMIENRSFNIDVPTFFEFITVMTFLYFSRKRVDCAVIETGMGGRLDATNVILPAVSLIMRIAYDHKGFLGETLTDIAAEKAGIIKNGVPVVSAAQEKEAEDIIIQTAEEREAPLYLYGRDFEGALRSSDINGITFDYYDNEIMTHNSELPNLFLSLAGEHQLINACAAIKAALLAIRSGCIAEAQKHSSRNIQHLAAVIKKGLASTRWRGRIEVVNDNPMIMIDGAHNPDAAESLSIFIKKYLGSYQIILVIGVMSDKDIEGILKPLLPLASHIIFTAPNYERAASPNMLAECAARMGFASSAANSVKEAIEMASKKSEYSAPLILITGSFYTIGEAMEALGETAVLGDMREKI
ncbi:MAG: bifunctional folylpolyglutamate synthase/dihydrofolate synthase [Nitrospirae bacterium]|nr:bifunctional folylpolyglutamate synthase/dihydrofolate synthase [Nitrospirota bacterium]